MEKKSGKVGEKEKPSWDWTHIECYLKTVEASRKSTIWNLTPSIILTNPSTDTAGPNVRLYIDTEKSLQYSHELGWNWHKSWNIPNISLRLEIKDEATGDFLLSPRNLYAQIFAVKRNSENDKADRMTLVDVGIRGESKMEMIDGQVYFSAIKFSSTTYNNEGINFNLLIVIYINEGEFEKPKVLTAVISPSIFVDSRRSARDYQEKKFSSFVEPFGYDTLEKEFIKRENKSKCENEVIIRNDPEGFYNYITAPNIRHKVKHPVFLAIKFSNCVRLLYNAPLSPPGPTINQLLENLQTKLLKETKGKQKNEGEVVPNLEEKHFVFAVNNLNDSLKRKKVVESIETMQNEFIGISCGAEELPACFQQLGSVQVLKKGYKDTYDSLVNICQNYEPEYQEESEDQYYSEQYKESEKSSKKRKEEPARPQRTKTTVITKNNPVERHREEIVTKKEELYESRFEAPAFFQENVEQKKPAASAFSKAVGFRNVAENNPIFDTTQLNKAFANPEYHDPAPHFLSEPLPKNNNLRPADKVNQNLLINQKNPVAPPIAPPNLAGSQQSGKNLGNFNSNMGGNSIYENLMYNNVMMSNWLGKGGNPMMEEMNYNPMDQLHKNNLERLYQAEQQQKLMELGRMPLPNEEQQSIMGLIQQIALYKEMLSQATYQNQILSRDVKQQQSAFGGLGGMKFGHEMQQFAGLPNMGYMGGLNMGGMMQGMQNNLQNIQNNLQTNLQNNLQNNMQNNHNLQNNLQGLQGMGNNLSTSNMQAMQNNGIQGMQGNNLQAMQNSNLQGLQGGNFSANLLGNNLMSNQMGLSSLMRPQPPPEKEQPVLSIANGDYELIRKMVLEEMKKKEEAEKEAK